MRKRGRDMNEDVEQKVKNEEPEPATALEAEPYVIPAGVTGKKGLPVGARVGIIIGAVVAAAYVAGVVFFSGHFLWNTSLNGVDVSGMTALQAQATIETMVQNYELQIQERENRTETITGADIDLTYELTEIAQQVMKRQNVWLWFYDGWKNKELQLEAEVAYDREKLMTEIQNLSALQETNVVAPKEPEIVKTGDTFTVKDGVEGTKLLFTPTHRAIRTGIRHMLAAVDLDKEGCYAKLQYTPEDHCIKEAVDYLNAVKDMEIIYQFGEESETLTGEQILDWIQISKNYDVTVDEEQVRSYIEYLQDTYEIRGQVINFHTSYGQNVDITSYIRSNDLNTQTELEQLLSAIEDVTEETQRFERDAQEMASVGDTYIEINLTAQHLYCYKNGSVILETDIVSGKPSTGCATPPGIYSIRSKTSPAILVGATYRTPVSYWMPFNGGIGLHDATWQSAYGGNLYLTKGSHGCINLPLDVAKFIYNNYSAGDTVVLYHLAGTETGSTTPAGRPESSPVPVATEEVPEVPADVPTEAPTEAGSSTDASTAATEATTSENTTTEAPTTGDTTTEAPTEATSETSTEATGTSTRESGTTPGGTGQP